MRWFLAAVLAVSAAAQPRPAATSDTHITIDGGQTFALPQLAGDWFATPTDAHVSIRLMSASGGPVARLDLQLDGRNPTQVINSENNSDLGGDHVEFYWTSTDHAVHPRGGDAITVNVIHLDDYDFEGRLSGTADRVKFSGTIHLHRETVPGAKVTGTYGNCDNVIHDKFAMAESRSPSDCEVKFDHMVREALMQALRPASQFVQANNWTVVKQSEVKTITDMARRSEQVPYRIESTHNGAFAFEFQLMGSAMAKYQERFNELTQRAADELKSGHPGPSYKQAIDFAHEMQGSTRLRLSASINVPSISVVSFQGGHKAIEIPGAAYSIAVSHAQAATGGGIDASRDESIILLGGWPAPVVHPQSDGGEDINLKAALNKAAPLTVQNIVIRIQANQANAQLAASKIDFAALDRLLHGSYR